MGLGKTLQATTIIACSAAERQGAAAAAANGQPLGSNEATPGSNGAAAGGSVLPSLVVCPSTLVGHWAHEINKYVDASVLRPLAVSGSPSERAAAAQQLRSGRYNVVIISYESLRSDADWAAGVAWDYLILDEGHVIRSTKSKLAQVGGLMLAVPCCVTFTAVR